MLSEDAEAVAARPKADVVYLGASAHYSPEQALQSALNEHTLSGVPLRDVVVLGYDEKDRLRITSSNVSREWALWMALDLVDYIRKTGRYTEFHSASDLFP